MRTVVTRNMGTIIGSSASPPCFTFSPRHPPRLQVLYLTDPVDEAMVTNMQKYGELELVDVSKEGLKLDDSSPEETKKTEEVAKEYRWD